MNPDKIENKLVLVTGANGFIASHCIRALLKNNCLVRGTVRDITKTEKYLNLYDLVPSKKKNLEIVEGDLLESEKWDKITKGCDYVLHIASPVYRKYKKREKQNLFESGKIGTRNILNACKKNKIKKIVITSSVAAIIYQKQKKTNFTENDYSSPLTNSLYAKTKLNAETEIHKFAFQNKGEINLTILNPGIVLGEYITPHSTASSYNIIRLFRKTFITKVFLAVVSIEDVVHAHLQCLRNLEISNGKRYLLVEKSVSFKQISDLLINEFSRFGYKIVNYEFPYFLMFLGSFFSRSAKWGLKNYGRENFFETERVCTELGVRFRRWERFVLEAAYSLIERGFIEDRLGQGFDFRKKIVEIREQEVVCVDRSQAFVRDCGEGFGGKVGSGDFVKETGKLRNGSKKNVVYMGDVEDEEISLISNKNENLNNSCKFKDQESKSTCGDEECFSKIS